MPLLTIVEDYLIAALKRATVETMEDGALVAYLPDIPGILAFGADQHECARELWLLLEEWVQTSLTTGYTLPIFDGIDLNADPAQILSSYHRQVQVESEPGDFFANEQELNAGFDQHGKAS
jgi:predicted RNase H-like HicB family nuclease